MSWIDQLQGQPIWRIAEAFGMQRAGSTHLGPCPACGETTRSKSDRRKGPLYVVAGARWRCGRCDAGGDVVALVAYALFRDRPPKGDVRWQQVRAEAAGRGWCDGVGATSTTWVAPRRDVDEELARPPLEQVLDVWSACRPVDQDREVGRWIASRLPAVPNAAAVVVERELVRALPVGVRLPPWATYRQRTWDETGHRAIFAMVDAAGDVVSLRARCIDDAGSAPKALPPVGYSVKGTAIANRAAVELLRDPIAARASASHVVIAEGEPQWLAWACRWPLATRSPVFGIVSGSWCDAMAVAVPSGAQVIACTDHDEAGDRYHAAIVASLPRATVRRWQGRRA